MRRSILGCLLVLFPGLLVGCLEESDDPTFDETAPALSQPETRSATVLDPSGQRLTDAAAHPQPRIAHGESITPAGQPAVEAMIKAVVEEEHQALAMLLAEGHSPDGTTTAGQPLLHVACTQANPRTALLLVRAGADCDLVDPQGQTPLDVLRRHGDMPTNLPIMDVLVVLQWRMTGGIGRALDRAEQLVHRGEELNQERLAILEEFEVDREQFKERAARHSYRITGGRFTLPQRFWDVPTEERPPGWMANYDTMDTNPQYEFTYEGVPLPEDFDAPLELPFPPQFAEAEEWMLWALAEAQLAYGTEDDMYQTVLGQIRPLARRIRVAQETMPHSTTTP
jgi:hypothetical protein